MSLAVVLSVAGCVASEPDPDSSGQGTLILSVGTGVATRADANGGRRFDTDKIASESDESLDDGDKMKNLRVWLVKDGVVSKFAKLDVADEAGEATLSCPIVGCERGDYEMYVVANYTGLDDACPVGKDLNTDNVLMKKYFGPVESGSCPAYSKAGMLAQVPEDALVRKPLFTDKGDNGTNVGMPLSYKGTVSIGPGENKISVELSRVCARFTMAITNNVKDKKLAINGVTLSAFNQAYGYLFPHPNASGDNDVPLQDSEIAFPYVENGGYIVIEPGNTVVLRDLYLFETDVTADKTFMIKAALYNAGDDPSMTTGKDFILSNVGNSSHGAPSAGSYYLIRSDLSSTFYLGADKDGKTNLFSFGSDNNVKNSPDIDEYLWEAVSVNGSSCTFKNLKHGTYLNVDSGSVSASSSRQSITYSGGYLYFSYNYWGSYYYITNSSNNPASVTSGANTWSLRKVKVTENPDAWVFEKPFKSLNYSHAVVHVDKYGVAYNLAQLKRNEQLKLNITVTYSDTDGACGFELGKWEDVTNETTFD